MHHISVASKTMLVIMAMPLIKKRRVSSCGYHREHHAHTGHESCRKTEYMAVCVCVCVFVEVLARMTVMMAVAVAMVVVDSNAIGNAGFWLIV